MEALTETHVTHHLVLPLWNFEMDSAPVRLGTKTSVRLLSTSERQSLYNLIKLVGSFPLMGIDRVRFGIDVEFQTELTDMLTGEPEELAMLALDALRILSQGGVQAPLRFHSIYPPNRWRTSVGASSSWSHSITNIHPLYVLSQDVVESLQEIWASLTSQDLRDNKILARLRYRLSHMYQSGETTDRLVDALIGLESIYLNSTDRTEITYKLSSRVAVFLEQSLIERKRLKTLIETLYNLRSKLVHGDEIKSKHLRYLGETLNISQFTDLAEEIFRRSILKLLTSHRTLLASHDTKYFDDLLLE